MLLIKSVSSVLLNLRAGLKGNPLPLYKYCKSLQWGWALAGAEFISFLLDGMISGPGVGWSHWAAWQYHEGTFLACPPWLSPAWHQLWCAAGAAPFCTGELQIEPQRRRSSPGPFTRVCSRRGVCLSACTEADSLLALVKHFARAFCWRFLDSSEHKWDFSFSEAGRSNQFVCCFRTPEGGRLLGCFRVYQMQPTGWPLVPAKYLVCQALLLLFIWKALNVIFFYLS